ncbi:helix-turn-helix domain-containing protein [Paenibacillus chartarius]|uniref:Helix-turn-helix domain-containing protein n=1 Tax=Paenibacillus chartarius TaxID=747481 RepID=A0ABV6DLE6_9BACL
MKIMIVDDEVIIRTGLAQVIKWEEYGLELLEPAESAEEALERMPNERPHILLTDIRMSGKTGLQLAEEAREMLPDLEVVILSGYDDFTYTQQAIRQQVGDYLLKTSRPEEIVKTVLAAKRRVEEKWAAVSHDFQRNREARNRLFERLVMQGGSGGADMQLLSTALVRLFSGTEPHNGYRVIIVCAEGWGETHKSELLLFAVDNMLNELMVCETLLLKNKIVAVVRTREGLDSGMPSRSMIGQIENLLRCRLTAAGGRLVAKPEQLHQSYETAEQAFRYRGLLPEAVWTYDQIEHRRGGSSICNETDEQELAAILLQNDPIALRSWAQRYVQTRLEDPQMTVDSLQASLRSAEESGVRWLRRVLAMTGREAAVDDGSIQAAAVSGLPQEDLFRYLHAIMKLYHNRLADGQTTHVRKAMTYIEQNLEDDVGLQHVARQVHLHPSHLSEVFKKETGMTFGDYVTRQKIARAKALLAASPAKISEIAQKLGYEDVKYFGQLFKKFTGKTPSEYRSDPLHAEPAREE